jgi:hypothetical protein
MFGSDQNKKEFDYYSCQALLPIGFPDNKYKNLNYFFHIA